MCSGRNVGLHLWVSSGETVVIFSNGLLCLSPEAVPKHVREDR